VTLLSSQTTTYHHTTIPPYHHTAIPPYRHTAISLSCPFVPGLRARFSLSSRLQANNTTPSRRLQSNLSISRDGAPATRLTQVAAAQQRCRSRRRNRQHPCGRTWPGGATLASAPVHEGKCRRRSVRKTTTRGRHASHSTRVCAAVWSGPKGTERLPKSGVVLRTAPHMHVLKVWMVKKITTGRRQPPCRQVRIWLTVDSSVATAVIVAVIVAAIIAAIIAAIVAAIVAAVCRPFAKNTFIHYHFLPYRCAATSAPTSAPSPL
jgi:hypothetical protein